MTKYAYRYNPSKFMHVKSNDVQNWMSLYNIINYNVTFIDRTGTVQVPIRTSMPTCLELPKYNSNFNLGYEDCCQIKVRELVKSQDNLDVPIRLLYSGGIDSSTILVSFIKELGLAEAEKRVQLVMSVEGIEENPWMWERVLRRSNFQIINSEIHDSDWGKDRILVGGEFNDQLMGSDIYKDVVNWGGDKILDTPWTQQLIISYLLPKVGPYHAEMWFYLMERIIKKSPRPVVTIAEWWQWINFTCKWSSVYFRLIACSRDNKNIDDEYLDRYYCQFFGDNNFQQWSMNNNTDKIKGTWHSYKWICKKLVADFCGQEYMYKVKRGSLWRLLSNKRHAEIIDNNYNFVTTVVPEEWYEPNNSFAKF